MDSHHGNTQWARADQVSSVTLGLFSWLEDMACLWQLRRLGQRRWIPTSLLFGLYCVAAVSAVTAYVCDVVALTLKDRIRERLDDRRAAAQLRRVIEAIQLRQASSTADS